MKEQYKIPLSKLVDEFHFEIVVKPDCYEDIQITTPEVNRPGLALAGFYELFEQERIQLIGKAEHSYLESLEPIEALRELAADLAVGSPASGLFDDDWDRKYLHAGRA